MGEGRPSDLLCFRKVIKPGQDADTETVFGQELDAIRERRKANFAPGGEKLPMQGVDRDLPSTDHGLAGIALSGGGIRSSAFCMGALQALARTPRARAGRKGCLAQFDYISTVSGGGYTGAALAATTSLAKNALPRFPFGDTNNQEGETDELRHIRDNSRYLLIGNPLFAVLSFIAIYLRGLMLSAVALAPPVLFVAGVLALAAWWMGNDAGSGPVATALSETMSALVPQRLLDMFHEIAVRLDGFLAASRDLICSDAAKGGSAASDGICQTDGLVVQFWRVGRIYWIILAVLLLLLALVVSIFSRNGFRVRFLFNMIVASIVAVVIILPLFIHANLKLMEIVAHASDAPHTGSTGGPPGLFSGFVAALTGAFPYLGAALVAILPFIRKLIDKSFDALVDGFSAKVGRAGSRVLLTVVALLLPLILWGMTLKLALILQREIQGANGRVPDVAVPFFFLVIVCLLFWFILDTNANSLHQLYRDRLSRAFVWFPDSEATNKVPDSFKLSKINTNRAPYPIFCAALSLPGSHYANRRARNAGFFIMTPRHFGCDPLKYVAVTKAEDIDGLDLGTAMAISGAAVAPNMGLAFSSKLAFTLAFLNVRLGRWMHRPDVLAGWEKAPKLSIPNVFALWKEALNLSGGVVDLVAGVSGQGSGERKPPKATWMSRLIGTDHIHLSDGGHIENLGVFELLRRRCKLIVAVDGEADSAIRCASLTQLMRLARLDLGVTIDLDPRPIAASHALASAHIDEDLPGSPPGALYHTAAGVIRYPKTDDGLSEELGHILYIKASLNGDEYGPVRAYRQRNKAFPQETTGDQMFSEEQYEAYRSLGDHIVRRVVDGQDQPTLPYWLGPAEQREIVQAVRQGL